MLIHKNQLDSIKMSLKYIYLLSMKLSHILYFINWLEDSLCKPKTNLSLNG